MRPGRAEPGRARGGEAGQWLKAVGRAGDLLPGPQGQPARQRHAGRGTVAMAILGGAGVGCAWVVGRWWSGVPASPEGGSC